LREPSQCGALGHPDNPGAQDARKHHDDPRWHPSVSGNPTRRRLARTLGQVNPERAKRYPGRCALDLFEQVWAVWSQRMKFALQAREHLEKARDSALLSVEFYNKPAVRFRSGGYITMMAIAWTSLCHAIFFKRRVKPFYRGPDKRSFQIQDGDYRYWELKTCMERLFPGQTNAVRANVERLAR
jgi:hypothetical protein